MKKSDWSYLLFGLLFTTVVACKPITEDDANVNGTEAVLPVATPATMVAQLATATQLTPLQPTSTPPLDPTSPPTAITTPSASEAESWQAVGGEATGLQIAIPPNWVNLSGQLDVSAAAHRLGLTVLFLTDSERTGSSLLAGKEIGSGAFVMGIIANFDLPLGSASGRLEQLLQEIDESEAVVSSIEPLVGKTASGTIAGAFVEMAGVLPGFPGIEDDTIHTRLLFFPHMNEGFSPVNNTQAIFLMGSTTDNWFTYAETFSQMMETIVIYDVQSGFVMNDGAANVVGELQSQDPVNVTLSSGVKDVWTFVANDAQYATLTLHSDNQDLDLMLSVVGPSGQTVTTVDNGYTGDTEIAADILLIENGRYIVEVSEFFNKSGRYTLSLVLTNNLLFDGGGTIKVGQTIQSDLVADQHVWSFDGMAEQVVSIVLAPGHDEFDAILDLYGPDGQRLVALDEGFSGDAEVISGFTLPLTGEYMILVRSFDGEGGLYTLSLDEGGEETLNFYEAGDLFYDSLEQEMLQPHEAHAWYFEGKAGDEIMLSVTPLSENLDLDIWLFDPTLERLAAKDDFLAGEPEMIMLTLPLDGQYLVLVRDFFGEAGEYEIRFSGIASIPPVYAGMLAYNETIVSTLAPGQSVVWLFNGQAGDTIDIDLTPEDDIDFLFILQDPEENQVLEVDSALSGEQEMLEAFTLTADGDWGILIKTFFNEGGPYQLVVQPTP